MKRNRFVKLLLAAFLFSGLIFSSCKKNSSTPTGQSITDVVAGNADLSYLSAAITTAGLSSTFSSAGAYTMFAPTNEAFQAAGYATIDAVNAADPNVLSDILQYHTLNKIIKAMDLPTGPDSAAETLNTDSVYLTNNNKGIFINGTTLLTGDAPATNGLVHTIGKLLTPPVGNIIATIEVNPDLTFLVAAIQRASEGSTDLFSILEGDGPYTLFAPTNEAFIAAGYATIADIQAADPDALSSLLTYHIINVLNFSSDFYDGYNPVTFRGTSISINATGGFTVKGTANLTAANITLSDFATYNGVVHIIDRVLIPF